MSTYSVYLSSHRGASESGRRSPLDLHVSVPIMVLGYNAFISPRLLAGRAAGIQPSLFTGRFARC